MKIFFSFLTFFFLSLGLGITLQKSIQSKKKKTEEQIVKLSEEAPPIKTPIEKKLEEKQEEILKPKEVYKTKTITIKRNMTFYGTMRDVNFPRTGILEIITASKPIFNLANIPVGSRLEITFKESDKTVTQLRILISEDTTLLFEKENEKWVAKKEDPKWTLERRAYSGVVRNSLWASLLEQELGERVVYLFAEIFAWQVDFGRETRKGDQWKILIEEKRENGRLIAWGNIIYAEYKKADGTLSEAVRFPPTGTKAHYYSLDGNNLAGLFLKSPVNFTRISSKFQRKRYHPILKFSRPHYGIDYAAARGTPVYAIGDGVITKAAYSRGSGNYIQIRHNRVYESAYRHLHKFAKKIKKNRKVKQGEVIGYVGSTGLATGPHLHFEFLKNRKYIDPLSAKFPRASSVAKEQEAEFKRLAISFQNEFGLLSQN